MCQKGTRYARFPNVALGRCGPCNTLSRRELNHRSDTTRRWLTIANVADVRSLLNSIRPAAISSTNRTNGGRSFVLWALATGWVVAVVGGLSVLWAYDNTPGTPGKLPGRWPAETSLVARDRRADARSVRASAVLVHAREPRRAGRNAGPRQHAAEDLRRLPEAVWLRRDWEKTDLWRTAANLPERHRGA